jgi:hypothetical protein
MDTLNTGGGSVSVLGSNASPRQRPDISTELLQVKESLKAWKQLIAEGKVESLVVKVDSLPQAEGVGARMLSEQEQQQLQMTKVELSNYLQRILQTPILD